MNDLTQDSRNKLRKMFNDQESGRFLYDTYISIDLAGDFACAVVNLIEGREAALIANANQHKLAMDAACGEIELLQQRLTVAERLLRSIASTIPHIEAKNNDSARELVRLINLALTPKEQGAGQ